MFIYICIVLYYYVNAVMQLIVGSQLVLFLILSGILLTGVALWPSIMMSVDD